jgi:hypothetical protein
MAAAFTSPRTQGEVRAERARVRGRFRESELVEAAPHPDPLHSPSKTGVNALKASGEREKRRHPCGIAVNRNRYVPALPALSMLGFRCSAKAMIPMPAMKSGSESSMPMVAPPHRKPSWASGSRKNSQNVRIIA